MFLSYIKCSNFQIPDMLKRDVDGARPSIYQLYPQWRPILLLPQACHENDVKQTQKKEFFSLSMSQIWIEPSGKREWMARVNLNVSAEKKMILHSLRKNNITFPPSIRPSLVPLSFLHAKLEGLSFFASSSSLSIFRPLCPSILRNQIWRDVLRRERQVEETRIWGKMFEWDDETWMGTARLLVHFPECRKRSRQSDQMRSKCETKKGAGGWFRRGKPRVIRRINAAWIIHSEEKPLGISRADGEPDRFATRGPDGYVDGFWRR